MKVYTVVTISCFGDTEYYGDILLVTDDEQAAKKLSEDYSNGIDTPGIEREYLAENDGIAIYIAHELNVPITFQHPDVEK